MQLTLEQYESIQNYLDGLMSAQEQERFTAGLNQNSFLKESFEFEKELRKNLASLLDKKNLFEKEGNYYEVDTAFEHTGAVRSLLEKSRKEWQDENKKLSLHGNKTPPRRAKIIGMSPWIITAAASCIILAIISLKWFIPGSSFSPSVVQTSDTLLLKEDTSTSNAGIPRHDSIKNIKSQTPKINLAALFKKYHSKDTASPQMPDVLAMVPRNYQNGDYSFQQIDLASQPHVRGSAKDINSPQNILQFGHYYKGLSFIETNDDKKAIENLQWVADSAMSLQLKIKAQWYLALIDLREGNTRKSIALLSSLSKNSKAIPYNRYAGEIIEKLQQHQQR